MNTQKTIACLQKLLRPTFQRIVKPFSAASCRCRNMLPRLVSEEVSLAPCLALNYWAELAFMSLSQHL